MKNYILTGASGILGSHILYELIHEKINSDTINDIIIFVRPNKEKTSEERVLFIFNSAYLPDYLKSYEPSFLASQCKVISVDLRDLFNIDSKTIPNNSILIHAGSSVNLGTDTLAQKEVFDNNYQSTVQLFHTLKDRISNFIFISTAFGSGHRKGKITNEFLDIKENDFRNYYETFKNKLEKELFELCNSESINFQIFRPSVICGRLLDSPKYVINKFLVFYLFGYFFSELVRKNKTDQHIRIYIKNKASLNIVPVDYVSKVIVKASGLSDIKELNIVSKTQTKLKPILKSMLAQVGFDNYSFVYEMPEQLNLREKNYYRWIDSQLHSYIHTPMHFFDTGLLETIQSQDELMNVENHFEMIFNYALEKKFLNG